MKIKDASIQNLSPKILYEENVRGIENMMFKFYGTFWLVNFVKTFAVTAIVEYYF